MLSVLMQLLYSSDFTLTNTMTFKWDKTWRHKHVWWQNSTFMWSKYRNQMKPDVLLSLIIIMYIIHVRRNINEQVYHREASIIKLNKIRKHGWPSNKQTDKKTNQNSSPSVRNQSINNQFKVTGTELEISHLLLSKRNWYSNVDLLPVDWFCSSGHKRLVTRPSVCVNETAHRRSLNVQPLKCVI